MPLLTTSIRWPTFPCIALALILLGAGCSTGQVPGPGVTPDSGTVAPDGTAPSGDTATLPPPGPDDGDEPVEPDEPAPAEDGGDGSDVAADGIASDGPPGDATADATADAAGPRLDAGPPPLPPQKQVFFTSLEGADNDVTLENKLKELLALTPAGAEVRVALYTFSRTTMADAFVAASDRGVDVRFVLDNSNVHEDGTDYAAVARLKAGLPAGHVTVCEARGSCIGTGINHNKVFLFSELQNGARQVVVQSSANLTTPQLRLYNNMVVIRDDSALYAAYRGYWDDLRAQQQDLGYYRSVNGDTDTKVYFFPRDTGDTLVGVLENVACEPGATVRLTQAFFTDARLAVAQALGTLKRAGCTVEVLAQEDPAAGSPGTQVVSTLRAAGVRLVIFPQGTGRGIHSKIVLVDAPYVAGSGHTPQKLIWTGSHNLTGPALRSNDETLLKLDDAGLFAAFTADWERVRDAATAAMP